jgi:predicted dehydrogenase
MVGFNRRYAPLAKKMKDLLETQSAPKSMIMTVNAGSIPEDHWINDPDIGGGRILGECCHFIDLLRFIASSPIKSVSAHAMGRSKAHDTLSISLRFLDGSLGAIHYFANGNRRFPKERLEVFSDGRILQLDNFKSLRGFGWPTFKRQYLLRQDKGQRDCARSFVEAITSGDDSALIPIEQLIEVSKVTLDITKQLVESP